MRKIKKVSILILGVLLAMMFVVVTASAHSGRTDSSGGHKDNKNKSGLGGYHYHCGGYPAHLHDDGYCPYTDVMPSKVTVNVEKKTLGIGEKTSIDAVVSPSNACDTSVSWSSSDTNVVQISSGTIEAVGYGTATISASTINGKTGSVTITVKEIVAEAVEIRGEKETLIMGEDCTLSAVLSPENVDDPTITWTSSDESIATVSSAGLVQGLLPGEVVITATASNGVSSSKTLIIQEVIAEKLEIKAEESVIHGDSMVFEAKLYPENTSDQRIEWISDNKAVASIDANGKLLSYDVGKVTITAKQKDVSASVEIEVLPRKVEKIIIESPLEEEKTLYPEDTLQLTAVIEPENATYPTVYWKSSDSEIVSVDENGNLTANKSGTAVITAYTEDGCEESYEIEVVMEVGGAAAAIGGIAILGVGGLIYKKKRKKMA